MIKYSIGEGRLTKALLFVLISWISIFSACRQVENRNTCTDSTAFDFKESITFYNNRLSIDSTDQIAYFRIGMAYYKLSDYKESIHYFDRLEILNPAYPALFSNRGICKLLDGNRSGACADFGLSLKYGEDPEIMDGQSISQWMQKGCTGSGY